MLGAAALAAACAPQSSAPIEVRGDAPLAGGRATAIRILVRPDHRHYAARYLDGAIEAVREIDSNFGGYDESELVLVDADWHRRAPSIAGATLLPPVRWWTTETAMAPELSAARAVNERFWTSLPKTGELPLWLRDGLAELSARRAAAAVFGRDNLMPGYAFMEQRFFGGFVPHFVRIRLGVETFGDLNAAYRARPHVAMTVAPPAGAERYAAAGKAILTLATLDGWLGRPTSDEIVGRFAALARERPVRLDDFERIASEVSGQNLTWLFDAAFRSTGEFDYGVDQLTSVRDGDGYATTVRARRVGDALFTGSSASRVGSFNAGRGVSLRLEFADGTRRTDYWDGRDREKTFRYRSPSPAVAASADPDRILMLDFRQTDNGFASAPATSTAATLWAARYAHWLQNLLVTYASLI